MNYIRFTGEVSIIVNKGKRIARANFICPDTGRRKQIGRNVGGDKAKDEKAAKEKVVEAIEKILNRAPDKKRKTFDDLADYFIEHRAIPAVFVENVKVAGMKSYKSVRDDIKVLRKYFGKMMLEDISRENVVQMRLKELKRPVRRVRVVDDVKEAYMKPRALASVHHQIRTLQSAMNTAVEIGWLDRLPSFKGLASISIEPKREIIPTEADVQKLLTEARKSEQIALPALILLVADCGARPIEAYTLLWKDVDFINETVTLTSDKGRRRTWQAIGMTERVKDALEKLPRKNEFVFGGVKSMRTAWRKARERANCEHIILYSLRHLYSIKLEQNKDLSDLHRMLLMRHSRPATRSFYTQLTPEVLKLASDGIVDAGDSVN